MGNKYKVINQRGLNYLTLTVVGWIDIFSRKKYRDLVIDSLQYCIDQKGLHVHGYVILTNHIHLVVSASGKQTLSEVIGNFKLFTATSILKDLPQSNESRRKWLLYLFGYFAKENQRPSAHQFWQCDNHPIDLYTKQVIQQKLNYTHNNPVRSNWVRMPQHYIYSSASNYLEEGKGVLQVDLLDEYYSFG
jgi:putative transposase